MLKQQKSSEKNLEQIVSFCDLLGCSFHIIIRICVVAYVHLLASPYEWIADIDLATITDRMAVKKAVQAGNVEDAIEKVNDLNPEVWLLFFPFQTAVMCVTWSEGLLGTTSLHPWGISKVCVWDLTGMVLLLNAFCSYHSEANSSSSFSPIWVE